MKKRFFCTRLAALASALTALALAPALAQGPYPGRTVTVIVPQAAGGANDAIARIVTQKLGAILGQTFLVDNRPGAGGNVGTAQAAKAKADGYTLLLTTNSAHVINPSIYKSTGFDPVKDFEPVGLVASAGYVLVANSAFAANSVAELIAQAKAQPGQISYASAGNGTLNHLIGEMLKRAAGVDMLHVPYKGSASAAADVAGGQVPVSVQSLPSSLPFLQSGKIKVLGVVNEKRLASLPNAPTIGETLPGFGSTPWYGLLAPAGTPREVVARLQAALEQTLASKEVADKLAAQGCEVLTGGPVKFAALIRDDLPRWNKIVKDSGAQID
ncbi:MAG: tripartite tricarboxylate transporter substrate binding protein [Polaromonas sp.]|nr:tripartite tricarboxylate transporter substrate binding protein [Polaromonas sp.]